MVRVGEGAGGQWHVALCLEMEDRPTGPNRLPPVGVDRSVEIPFATSDGEQLHREMWTPGEQRRLLALQRRKARQLKGSNRYRRTCRSIARLYAPAADRRRDFAHKISTHLAKSHGLAAVEHSPFPP